MGKYDPLKGFLAEQGSQLVSVSFAELEGVLGMRLPNSKRYPAWWSNNPSNNPMTKVWLEAGFQTEQVDTTAERLVFRRVGRTSTTGPNSPPPRTGGYPGIGAMAGTVRLAPGVDLTEPADPHWSEAEA